LRDDHHVDLGFYLGKGTTSAGIRASKGQTNAVHLPGKEDIDRADKQLRKSSDEFIRVG
jgi:hypothetical protein